MWRLRQYIKPFLPIALAVMALVFLEVMATLKLPDLMSEIVDLGIAQGDIPLIWRTGGVMLLVALAGAFCAVLSNLLGSLAATGLGRDLRIALFSQVERFAPQEFNKFGTASLITRTTNDVQQMQMVFLMTLRMALRAPLMAAGGVLMVVKKDSRLAMILLALIPVIGVMIAIVLTKGVPLFKSLQHKLDRLNLVLREQLMGVRVIRAFDRGMHERERFGRANLDLTQTTLKVNRIMITLMPVMTLLINFTSIAIIWFGAKRIDAGLMQVGDMMAFLQYSMQILWSIMMLSMLFVMLPRASASGERLVEVLETAPSIQDPPRPLSPRPGAGILEFKNVTFYYPGAEVPVLSDISFTARPGQVTAIIGGTGSGKSTLLDLIPRFYDIQSGSITLDGVDIRHMAQADLRSRLGYVPQRAVLFSGTIKENIRHGKKTATDQEVAAAARTAQAADFIEEREEGYDSYISQGGTNVSGGQKQRLSIARALARKPQIYLLDDTFSALDYKTDAKLRRELARSANNATTIIVAQRVSTVLSAEQIIVLDAGRIVGRGTHQELLSHSKVYQEIVASQLDEEAVS
ncbi:MAG: ABC transporter ATP-binding protein [Firmicutes bacterium]|nr:ABC transporter ATP-binding protein [Bacillota bacterium]